MNTSRALLTGIAALFLVTGAAHTTAAHAEITEQLMPTDKWIKYCRGGADPSAKWYQWVCSVYIKGVSDGLIVSDKICAPNSMTVQKAMDVVIAKAASHPELQHEYFGILVTGALIEEFPCASARIPRQ